MIFILLTKLFPLPIIYNEVIKKMGLVIKIREQAEKRGYRNANQLGVALGVAPNVSSRLWNGEFTKIGVNTIEKLCEVLNCQPNALFRYESGSKI